MSYSILDAVTNLPDELIIEIYFYIPVSILMFLTKKNHILYHYTLSKTIIQYESYIRDTIRRDNDYIFNILLQENYHSWLKQQSIVYKNTIYANYIYFILGYCIDNNSHKCRYLINDLFQKIGLSQNLHKKNIVKHIRWKK